MKITALLREFGWFGGTSRASAGESTKSLTIIRDNFVPVSAISQSLSAYIGTEGLMSNVVMAPVLWIMRTFTEAQAVVQRRLANLVWEYVLDHELEQLLDRPNEAYDGDALWKATCVSYVLAGNGYWRKVRNRFGDVIALWYVPHWLMTPRYPSDGSVFISHYDFTTGHGPPEKLLPRDVVHFRFGLDPENPRLGLSPLRPLLREVYSDDDAALFTQKILENMGVPGLVMSPKGEQYRPKPDEVEKLREYLKVAFSGIRRGEPMVMGVPTEVSQFGFDPNKLMLTNLRDIAEERVCLHPQTQIITKRGVVPITEVRVGDQVVTHRGRWRSVRAVSETPIREPMLEIRADGLEPLRATESHRVLAATYGPRRDYRLEYRGADWIAAAALVPRVRGTRRHRHHMTMPVLRDERPDPSDVRLELRSYVAPQRFSLREEGGVLVHPSPRVQSVTAQPALSAALGRLLGFYLAEGCSAGNRVSWYFHENEIEFQEAVQRDLLDVFGVESSIREIPQHHVRAVVVQSAMLARLFDLGTAPTKRLPEWAWDGGREFQRALLWSWVQGDGSIRDNGGVVVTTMSRDLAWQMRLLAISCGYAASIRSYRRRPGTIDGRVVAHSGPVHVVSWSPPSVARQRDYRIEEDSLWTGAVRAVTPHAYDGPVYNLQIDEDESYLTTGGLVHNCAMLGIPAAVVGFGSGLQSTKVGATMRELRRLAWVQTLIPMQKSLAKQLSAQLLPDFVAQVRRFRVRFDTSDVSAFQEEDDLRSVRAARLVGAGILRVDRAQDMLGLQVDPTQQIYLRPSGSAPAGPDAPPPIVPAPAPPGSAEEEDEDDDESDDTKLIAALAARLGLNGHREG